MNYKIEFKGKTIAQFEELEDAEYFLGYKRESLLNEQNDQILDEIAQENGWDRNCPGLFSNDIVMAYYDKHREQMESDCRLICL